MEPDTCKCGVNALAADVRELLQLIRFYPPSPYEQPARQKQEDRAGILQGIDTAVVLYLQIDAEQQMDERGEEDINVTRASTGEGPVGSGPYPESRSA